MPLPSGFRLGPYELVSPLGAGGMGEVYKARDTRLERTVAVKVLPAQTSDSPELRQRFEREARTISQLSHSNICALYDVGNQDGIEYLVMEYLEGETLAARLARGPLPLEQTLRFGIQIADALDKAHRQGIVHRDLKPANVMVTKSGIKLVDFGLAKLVGGGGGAAVISATGLPTQGPNLTAEGTILGTLQYMAPEQLEGKESDARTDIFAFGALLYEMATGKKAFSGASQASLIASILERDPPAISSIQPASPPALDRVVKTCLAKDPEDRFQTAHDVRLQLQWVAEEAVGESRSGGVGAGLEAEGSGRRIRARARTRERLAWITAAALGAALAVALAFVLHSRGRAPEPGERSARKFSILPPEKSSFQPGSLALSPDGSRIAFLAAGPDGRNVLWVRPLSSLDARALPGTERAYAPFWSPDGRFLAFFADGKLKKIEAAGGPPQVVCDTRRGRGGAWNREGVILFAPFPTGPLYRVSDAGGDPTPVTQLDAARRENSHRWPSFLPDGRHFVYFARSAQADDRAVYVGSLDSKKAVRLMGGSSNVLFTRASAQDPEGFLLFEREGWLTARRFDPDKLAFTGEPVPIAPKVRGADPLRPGTFTASEAGVLAFGEGSSSDLRQLLWTDREGKPLGAIGSPGLHMGLSLSPDDKRVALDVINVGGERQIWLMELDRGVASRFTLSSSVEIFPVWSPDGSRIAFGSSPGLGRADLYQRPANGVGKAEPLLESETRKTPNDWSRDGKFLLYGVSGALWRGEKGLLPKTELWALPLAGEGERKPFPVVKMPFNASQGSFSPDSRWIAYVSDESGKLDVYAQSFPAPAAKFRISTEGGVQPRWRPDGKEIFYLAPDGRLMAAAVKGESTLEVAGPSPLFKTETALTDDSVEAIQFAVASDGRRFLFSTPVQSATSQPITVVLDWSADLKKR